MSLAISTYSDLAHIPNSSSPDPSGNSNGTLDSFKKGERCVVASISSNNRLLKSKLLTMGIVAGTLIEVTAIAPLGDPMTIKTMGYSLSLRLSEASQITVIPQNSPANR